MVLRIGFLSALLVAAITLTGVAEAQDDDLPVVVVELKNPFDQRLLDFAAETLADTPAHLFVLQVDAPGISSGEPGPLYAAIGEAEAPVVVWIGSLPAVAYGGAGSMLNIADLGAAAPGTRIGYLEPTVAKGGQTVPLRIDRFPGATEADRRATAKETTDVLRSESVVIEDSIPGYVDYVVPTVGQLIVGLDGASIVRGDAVFEISTAERVVLEDGTEVASPSRPVRFVKPGLLDRFLRLASRPETTLFFLVAGIIAATFEFYAAGPGVTAAASVVAFLVAGYGLATLPMSWPSVGGVVAGMFLYTWDFQRNQLSWRSAVGTVVLLAGGMTFTAARPQFAPMWWIVVAIVAGAALFYGVGLTSIVRSRFSIASISREYLVGRSGAAETAFDPDGIVVVDDGRWRGRTDSGESIAAGTAVAVTGVDGVVLEVASIRGA